MDFFDHIPIVNLSKPNFPVVKVNNCIHYIQFGFPLGY